MATLQDITKQMNVALGWDPTTKNVTVGSTVYTPEQLKAHGLTLSGGRWQGTEEQLKGLTATPTVTPTVTPTTEQPTFSNPDYSQLLSGISDASRQANIAALQRAYQKSLGSLESERATIAPQFEASRSDIRRASMNQAKDFENFLATKGLARSGAAAQGEIASNVALTGAIGQSKTEEQRRLADIEKRRSELGTDLEFGIAQTEAQANLERMRAELQARQQADALAREDALIAEELARADALRAEETARSDFGTTIAANYQDISALVNRLRESGAPQWQIDQAEAARQQKIMELNLDPRTGNPLPVDTTPALTSSSAALDLWKQLGTANQAIANALDVPVGSQYRNFSTGSGGGTTTTSATGLTPKETISLTESTLRGTSGNSSADIMVQMNEQGYFDNLTPSELKTLMNKFGVTELMLEQAENRATIPAQGIPLPSQMGGLYGIFNNRQ